MKLVAALFVDPLGPYPRMKGVDCWDKKRDALRYSGPYAVITHPPCSRWGRYWSGGPSARVRRKLGDDGGCFERALRCVNKYGGVLEHPEGSHAFDRYCLVRPRWRDGWIRSGKGWVCCVAQGHYGHRARKLTWLYAVAPRKSLPELDWSIPEPRSRLDYGFHSKEERRRLRDRVAPAVNRSRLSALENRCTPMPFARVLVRIARAAGGEP